MATIFDDSNDIANKLGIIEINPNDINLSENLLKKD